MFPVGPAVQPARCPDVRGFQDFTRSKEPAMTHQRPIPEAAQSPYPLHPLPASAAADESKTGEEVGAEADAPASDEGGKVVTIDPRSWNRREQIGLGAALGIGSAALVAALLYSRRGTGGTDKRRAA
jgi:hypothetical protein